MSSDGTRRRDARRAPAGSELPPGPWGVLHGVLAFVLEVAALGACWYIGSRLVPGAGGVVLGLAVAAVFVVAWALFMAPRARRRIPWPWRPLAALALFVVVGAGLLALGQWAGAVMIAIAIADTVLAYRLRRLG
ncbi:hypothetical protein SCMU_25760 [Sinomonas cyclohexanicum]|uniref:DUF2568 domain-containing protein n=1 Tax=Sinomonas cyclohexanicum TaxID=322009 RepID=A0ABN6FJC7_SINCY|nr:YrdB family protein [Corynebacterium cyclohexanicum]BCT76734.1 hypothetical protein SCMU_25760 [Corynebacterium cyclohexanicum]